MDDLPAKMSATNSTLPPEYDDYHPSGFDPTFTANINTKMRVPHRLSAINGLEAMDLNPRSHSPSAAMSVPEKIVVAGQDQHIGLRPEPNLNLDLVPQQDSQYVGLQTPPRVLTVEESQFPTTGEEEEYGNKQHTMDSSIQNGYVTVPDPVHRDVSLRVVDTPTTPGDSLVLHHEDDDLTTLRRQVTKMSRKLGYLEQENDRRAQRELILYPLVIGYLIFRMASWLIKNN